MGSYFGEFTKALQGDFCANSAAHKRITPTWGHPPRAGSSSDDHVHPVYKHPTLQELVGTAFFSGGDIDVGDGGGVAAAVAQARSQISSPRDAGVKKRKNQTKRVVCVPAQDAAGGKPGGEGIPSDSWSWRKYGQKPIKGSPYPRGYYRCSSSKGCSARKQVERSKTEPNMMIVTYTSEHNHPFPTQKNSSPARKVASQIAAVAPGSKSEQPKVEEALHRGNQTEPPELSWTEDFFAELGELEEDTMKLFFSKELVEDKLMGEAEDDDALDIFRKFDWVKQSFEEAK